MMPWLGWQFIALLIGVFGLLIVIVDRLIKRLKNFSFIYYIWLHIARFISRHSILYHLLWIMPVLAVVLFLSATYETDTWLKKFLEMRDEQPLPGILFIFIVGSGTIFAVVNTILIRRDITSEIQDFTHLMREVNQELIKLKGYVLEEILVLRPFFYMYVKTPSLGNISADPNDYKIFETYLKTVVPLIGNVKIVCLSRDQFEGFHRTLSNEDAQIQRWTKQATDLFDFLRTFNPPAVKECSEIFNTFLVVTPHRAFEFIIKRSIHDRRHEVAGREIRNKRDILFARESFEQYWG